ncbi:hypothetical protein [Shinella sp. G-2]|uniref:hypothetical protein n=1 Tax=Shinella sp. G-2 TaxID=3133141 RepID=UPI003D042961
MTILNSVACVTATTEAEVYVIACNVTLPTDRGDITYDTLHCLRPDDQFGLSPILRDWMAEHVGEYEILPYVPPAEPQPVVIVYPVDLWSRMTDAEADAVEAAMAAQTIRVQNIFKSASSYRGDHELWPLLTSMAAELFGAPRAAEILAAS